MKLLSVSKWIPFLFFVLLSSCDDDEGDALIEWDQDYCEISSNLTSNEGLQWTAVRARYSGGDSKILTVQLMTPGSSGNWILPGDGWITLSVQLESPISGTLKAVDSGTLPTSLKTDEISAYFTNPSSGYNIPFTGTIEVSSNIIDRTHQTFMIGLDFTDAKLAGGHTVKGSVFVSGENEDSGQNSGGTGDCQTCDKIKKVVDYNAQANQIPECASCSYCAAMYLAKCFLERKCYKEAGAQTAVTKSQLEDLVKQNKDLAAALGNNCP